MRKNLNRKKLDIGRYLRYLTGTPDGSPVRPFDPGQIRPVYVLRFVCIIAIVTLIPFGILALVEKNNSVGIMDLSLVSLLIGNYLHAHRYKRYTFNIYLGVSLAAMLFVYMFLTAGMNRGGFVWYYTFPVVACFLLGSKKGAIATALISLPVVILFLVRAPLSIFSDYSLDFKLRFISSFSVVFAFSYLFEYSREKNRVELRRAHEGLEKRFEERTSALQALQGAIQSLQKEINERRRVQEALRESEEGARRLAQENAIFAEISRILSSTLNIDEVYDRFAAAVRRLIHFDRISICAIDSEKQTVTIAWAVGPDRLGRMPGDVFPLCRSDQREFLQTRSSVFIQTEDRREIEERFPFLLSSFQYGFRSCISVPLILKDQVIGTLNLRSFKVNAYTERDLKVVERLGFQISGAVTNVLLFNERMRAEEALKKKTQELALSNKNLEQFAYVASHDLQEPLRMVASYVQLLAERYKGKLDSDADEFITFAVDGAIRMRKLINDLLTYSRVGTEGKELEPAGCETALHQSLDNLKVAIEENAAIVTHDALPTVMADNAQLVELFQNLIGNAIKFRTSEPPRVHVSASRNGNGWIFSVRDNGIGIAPEYAKRIFVIFQRLHGREKYAGTGIGLAICQKIVERHGGHIWVESELGKGATFYFSLPASEAKQFCP